MRTLRTALFRAELDQREASLLRAIPIEIRKYLRRRGLLDADEPVMTLMSALPLGPSTGSRRTGGTGRWAVRGRCRFDRLRCHLF